MHHTPILLTDVSATGSLMNARWYMDRAVEFESFCVTQGKRVWRHSEEVAERFVRRNQASSRRWHGYLVCTSASSSCRKVLIAITGLRLVQFGSVTSFADSRSRTNSR